MTFIVLLSLSYILGSINSAIIVCFLLKLPSPRTVGSGNPGTTNILRLGGKKAAIVTLLGDMLKGFIPVITTHMFQLSLPAVAYIGLVAVIGHIFPIFWGFRGGKGVATLMGVTLGFDCLLGVLFLLIWTIVALITRYSSLAAILATAVSSIFVIFYINFNTALPFLIMAIIVIVRHHQNIKRLLLKTETKIGKRQRKKQYSSISQKWL